MIEGQNRLLAPSTSDFVLWSVLVPQAPSPQIPKLTWGTSHVITVK